MVDSAIPLLFWCEFHSRRSTGLPGHDTSDQRSRWLMKGFRTGNPAEGDTFTPTYSQL